MIGSFLAFLYGWYLCDYCYIAAYCRSYHKKECEFLVLYNVSIRTIFAKLEGGFPYRIIFNRFIGASNTDIDWSNLEAYKEPPPPSEFSNVNLLYLYMWNNYTKNLWIFDYWKLCVFFSCEYKDLLRCYRRRIARYLH